MLLIQHLSSGFLLGVCHLDTLSLDDAMHVDEFLLKPVLPPALFFILALYFVLFRGKNLVVLIELEP